MPKTTATNQLISVFLVAVLIVSKVTVADLGVVNEDNHRQCSLFPSLLFCMNTDEARFSKL